MEWIVGFVIMAVHAAMIIFEPVMFYFGPDVLPEQFGFDDVDCKNCNDQSKN